MKLSTRGEYATKAVLHLTLTHPEVVTIHEIAEEQDIPVKYLEQILLRLKNGGLVRSKRGMHGGYQLAKAPEQITIGEVIRIMDGPLAPIGCVSISAYEKCPKEEACGVRGVWLEVRNAIAEVLDNKTFADIARDETTARTNRTLMYHI